MTRVIRQATIADAPALAELRWLWSPPAAPTRREDFVAHLTDWMHGQGERSVCAVAELDGELVGMAWLAVYERVPNADTPVRLSGDIQSLYVLPHHRGRGIGALLIELLIDVATTRGVAKITADSSDLALPLYRRLGFTGSDRLLQRFS